MVTGPTEEVSADSVKCEFQPGQYGFFSWTGIEGSAKHKELQYLRKDVSTFMSNLHLRKGREKGLVWSPAPVEQADDFFSALDNSCLTTPLSTWWPHEDITEYLTLLQLSEVFERINVKIGGREYNLLEKLRSGQCAEKTAWAVEFMKKEPNRFERSGSRSSH